MSHNQQQRSVLQRIAYQAMLDRGLYPEFPRDVFLELEHIGASPAASNPNIIDLRGMIWSSIDNDDSLDLDQLTVAEKMPDDTVKIFVAIADVDLLVKRGSAIDSYASHNTTSVYTAAEIFPMLPNKLSTDLTSLNYANDRIAVIVEMIVAGDGTVLSSNVYRAVVRNHAKLAYNSVAAWLSDSSQMPTALAEIPGLADNIQLQYKTARKMRTLRQLHGALDLETIEARPVFVGNDLKELRSEKENGAKDIIEDFMIAANGVVAKYLVSVKFPSIRRVVRIPKRWDRIVELAAERGKSLPQEPDSKALEKFLLEEKKADPLRFPDLSLSVIKLMGKGEYIVELPGESVSGHFGLAVRDYSHSTAPNRRFPDLVTQRLVKAALNNQQVPYHDDELKNLAYHCTMQEDAAKKVERQVAKSAAAMLLQSRIGETFDAIVTGAADKGTWVRIMQPPVEGKLISGYQGLDVGQLLRVQLVRTDVGRGFIDFKKAEFR
jgi:exoribonuclease-2